MEHWNETGKQDLVAAVLVAPAEQELCVVAAGDGNVGQVTGQNVEAILEASKAGKGPKNEGKSSWREWLDGIMNDATEAAAKKPPVKGQSSTRTGPREASEKGLTSSLTSEIRHEAGGASTPTGSVPTVSPPYQEQTLGETIEEEDSQERRTQRISRSLS